MRLLPFIITLAAAPVTAQDVAIENLTCRGDAPDWTLDILAPQAQFRFADRTIDFDIQPPIVAAEGRTDPRALTLLTGSDTAIVLLSERICRIGEDAESHSVDILTQRRGLPILLTGCCRALP